ncbi:amino acid permease ScVBA-like protein [Armillaria solidipes]|uniref:Amino acid permease ScVBA-like protein n=1 Tax=Armillaria solidipes TaxID=1076256 RepID=A0A2H3C1Y0_9AGAR|nr:amino acid permease ScVBA-like protein [Armillaria solidipes]
MARQMSSSDVDDLFSTTHHRTTVDEKPISQSPDSSSRYGTGDVGTPSILTLDSSSSTVLDKSDQVSQHLSTFRILMVHIGAALTLFLATTDANIVSTSLPTISNDLQASQSEYTWVGVAYMLTQTAFQPLYGRISDVVGRKCLLFASVIIFALGNLVCGASNNITMLIGSRALAGVGGGGIVSSVWVITAEIVEAQHRAKWSQALSITWSCSAVAGPLLGGLFSGNTDSILSWRWGFYLNLPICAVASLVLACSLHGVTLQKSSDYSLRTILQRFDFGGLILFMTGTSFIVVGFSFADENGWKSATTITMLVLGLLILVGGGVYETYTGRDCLFPTTVFTDRSAIIILVVTFVHNFAYTAGLFYLAFFFQSVDNYTPLQAGIRLLPFSLGSSLASMPAAWFIAYWQSRRRDLSGQNWIMSLGLLISTVGFGLLILLKAEAPEALEVLFPLICGIGMGVMLHAPYQIFVRTLKSQELATGTSAFFLVRFTGATVGLAVAGSIFYARASSRLPSDLPIEIQGSSLDFSGLNSIEPMSLRWEVLNIVATSVQTIWVVCTPCLGLAFLLSLLVRKLPIDRTPEGDSEKQTSTASTV